MFYFTDENTGTDIGIPGEDIDKIYEDGVGGSVIELKKANRVYTSSDTVVTIHSRNKNYALILVTVKGIKYIYPTRTIKSIKEFGTGSVVFFRTTKLSKVLVDESVATIVSTISVVDSTVLAFIRHPSAISDPSNFKNVIRITLTDSSTFDLDLSPLLIPNDLAVVQTTDATQATFPNSPDIAINSVQSFVTRITAIQSAGTAGTVGDVFVKEYKGAIKNIAGTTTIVGGVGAFSAEDIAIDAGAVLWSIDFVANDTTDKLDIKFTGELDKTIEVKAETIFGTITY